MAKRALITGITGQDGSYLAEFLLDQGYEVSGMVRRSSTLNFERIAHIQDRITLVAGDLLDEVSMINILRDHRPTEVYNLAAQSFVQTSWSQPVLTGETTALGVTRVLDAIRIVDPEIRFYQASSSEMFGKVLEVPQRETTPFYPAQPLRRGQGLRPLDHRQLPRELRPPRVVGDPVQPRVAPARPRVRDPQGDPRRGPDQGGDRREAGPRQPRRPARLGLRRRLRAGHVADAPAGPARRLRRGHRRDPLGQGAGASWPSPPPASTGRSTWSSTSASCARPRSTCWSATRPRPRRRSAGTATSTSRRWCR